VFTRLIRFGAACSVLVVLAACAARPVSRSPQDGKALAQEKDKFIA